MRMQDVILRAISGEISWFAAAEILQRTPRNLRRWRERFMARLADVRRLGYDDRFIRLWEYYLAYCEAAFTERWFPQYSHCTDRDTYRRQSSLSA